MNGRLRLQYVQYNINNGHIHREARKNKWIDPQTPRIATAERFIQCIVSFLIRQYFIQYYTINRACAYHFPLASQPLLSLPPLFCARISTLASWLRLEMSTLISSHLILASPRLASPRLISYLISINRRNSIISYHDQQPRFSNEHRCCRRLCSGRERIQMTDTVVSREKQVTRQ